MNIYGLFIMAIVMIPNIIFAIKEKNFESKYHNKAIQGKVLLIITAIHNRKVKANYKLN